jgi:hypothetical protein
MRNIKTALPDGVAARFRVKGAQAQAVAVFLTHRDRARGWPRH